MERQLHREVWQRAGGICEYCLIPQEFDELTFEIDHIRSRKHGGKTISSNCALSCFYCNSFKGSDIAGIDKKTGRLTRLFNPRRQKWDRHFRYSGAVLVGRTAVGRVTAELLQINIHYRIALRQLLTRVGAFPPR